MNNKNILTNFFLLFAGCLLAFLIGETTLRFLGFYGEIAGSVAPAQMLVDDDILDYRIPPNFKGVTQYGYPYQANSKGWRDYEYSSKKPKNTFRIVMLGDSVLNGHGVRTEEIFGKHLERQLNAQKTKKI